MNRKPESVKVITTSYRTPRAFYDSLDTEFGFDFDPCPFNPNWNPAHDMDGTAVSWAGKRVFCNPPYGKDIPRFLAKANEADIAVFLVPARTDTKWFHDIVWPSAEVRFIRGRLKNEEKNQSWPFPVIVAIFRKYQNKKEK